MVCAQTSLQGPCALVSRRKIRTHVEAPLREGRGQLRSPGALCVCVVCGDTGPLRSWEPALGARQLYAASQGVFLLTNKRVNPMCYQGSPQSGSMFLFRGHTL